MWAWVFPDLAWEPFSSAVLLQTVLGREVPSPQTTRGPQAGG